MRNHRALSFAAFSAVLAIATSAAAEPQTLGLNAHQSADVGMDVAKAAKVKWVRLDFNWLQIEPSSGVYDWTLFDSLVAAANARDLSILAVLAYTPSWASQGDTKSDGSNNDVPVDGAYAAFVTAAVDHFKSSITYYEMWNEPNLDQFFEGTPSDYTSRVLVPGADAVHAACATCKVVGPALATVGTEYATWMDASLTAAQSKMDVVSGHIYAPFVSEDATAGLTADSFMNKLETHRIVKVGSTTVYEGPLSFREVLDAHGWTGPFWLTETGLGADPTSASDEAKQVTRYTNTLEAMNTRPWWTNTIFYEAYDEPGSGNVWGVAVHDTGAASGYDAKPVLATLADWVFTPESADGGAASDAGSPGGDGGSGTGSGGAGTAGGDGNGDNANGSGDGASSGASGSSGESGCAIAGPSHREVGDRGVGGTGDRGTGDRGTGDRGTGDRGMGDRGMGLFSAAIGALAISRKSRRRRRPR